jgi:hypothetical protein
MFTWNSIGTVQESYRSAIQDGRLKCDREPRLLSKSDVSPKASLWDPYILTPQSVRHAVLDGQKLQTIAESIKSIIEIVPKADEWDAKAREHSLTPEDVQRILQTAFTQSSKQPEQDDKLSPILKIAAKVLRRANELKKKRDTFRREEAVLRMISYAVMEVSEVAGEATEDEVRYNRYRPVHRADIKRSNCWLVVGKNG